MEDVVGREVREARDIDPVQDIVQHGGGSVGVELDGRSDVGIKIGDALHLGINGHLRGKLEALELAGVVHGDANIGLEVRCIQAHVANPTRERVLKLRVARRVHVVVPVPAELAVLVWHIQVEDALTVVVGGVWFQRALPEWFGLGHICVAFRSSEAAVKLTLLHLSLRLAIVLPGLDRHEGVGEVAMGEHMRSGGKLLGVKDGEGALVWRR
mmetsp:Transcript_130540/g.279016  ORF Transcript_130540/g.279016 Transcript_130540/m.279016 type:complete len:212 (+) Transcript_130540:2878-3513(+)